MAVLITPLNGVIREELPHSLFGRGEYAVDEVEVTFALHRWVANRAPPRTRKDLDKIYDIDIREYSVERKSKMPLNEAFFIS